MGQRVCVHCGLTLTGAFDHLKVVDGRWQECAVAGVEASISCKMRVSDISVITMCDDIGAQTEESRAVLKALNEKYDEAIGVWCGDFSGAPVGDVEGDDDPELDVCLRPDQWTHVVGALCVARSDHMYSADLGVQGRDEQYSCEHVLDLLRPQLSLWAGGAVYDAVWVSYR